MNVWRMFLLFEMVLCGVVFVFVFIAWRRKRRGIAKAHSVEHRLKIPNLWTDTHHDKHSSTRVMRMKDGHFVALQLQGGTAKVLAGSQPGPTESFTELCCLQASDVPGRCSGMILDELASQLQFPQSVDELREKVKGLKLPAERPRRT
jgi:hypothetical protein